MTEQTMRGGAPSGIRVAAALLAIVGVAVGLFWLLRGGESSAVGGEAAQFATQCPRWARLAEELLAYEGGAPERCEFIGGKSNATTLVYQAAPHIEVDVLLEAAQGAIENVRIRDIRSHASVTYNAEALALLK